MKPFLSATVFLLPFVSAAQQVAVAPAAAVLADTAIHHAMGGVDFLPGSLRLLDGRTIQGYMPIPMRYPGLSADLFYYLAHPQSKPRPKKLKMEITKVHSITAGTHYLETMLLPDDSGPELYDPEILAERFVNGPVELFLQADAQQIPVPIPVAGSILSAGIPYTNSHFFVRRNGFLMQVSRGSFKEEMSQYLQDYPALAAKVRGGERNYHYRNLISIITEFNAHIDNNPGTHQ